VSYVYVYCSPVAEADGQLQTASWSDTRRTLARLQRPEEVGRIAARRAARMLGARKPKTQQVPVVFEPQLAAEFIGGISSAVNGLLVHKKSELSRRAAGQAGRRARITLVDDGTLEHGIATRPFDGEGVASRRTAVIEDGVLRQFLYDATTARNGQGEEHRQRIARLGQSCPRSAPATFI